MAHAQIGALVGYREATMTKPKLLWTGDSNWHQHLQVGHIERCDAIREGTWYAYVDGREISRHRSDTAARRAVEAAIRKEVK